MSTLMSRSTLALAAAALALLVRPAPAFAQDNPMSSCKVESTMQHDETHSEPIEGTPNVMKWTFTGSVRIVCDDTTVSADEMHWRDDEDVVYASGNVVFQQKGTSISAARAELNRKTHQGTFYDAFAMLQLATTGLDRSMFGGQEPGAIFFGERIEKIGDRTYKLTNGQFTTCTQPTPRWEMAASTVILVPDEHAILKNMVLKVKDVPVFYLPALYYPINKENRSTGFLMPSYGTSTANGFTLGNAFFWAINRSADATFYHDLLSKTGQEFAGNYRYVESSASQGNVTVQLLRLKALYAADGTTIIQEPKREYRLFGDVSQGLGRHLRLIGRTNYTTSIVTQELLQQNVADRSLGTRSTGAQVYGTWNQFRLSGRMEINDYFSGITSAQRQGVAPQVGFSSAEKAIGRSPVYVGLSSEFSSFIRQLNLFVPTPETSLSLWRTDINPVVRVPLSKWPFLSVSTSASWRLTHWSESLDDDGRTQLAVPLNRQIFQYQATVTGPIFTRIFTPSNTGYAEKFKHLIAPTFSIDRFTPFDEAARVVRTDAVDTVLGGYTQLRYGLTNRLLARRKGVAASAEILSVDVTQSYYSVETAASADQDYSANLDTAALSKFSPIRVVVNGRPTDQAAGRFQFEYNHQFGAIQNMGAGGSINGHVVQINADWSKRFVIPELPNYTIDRANQALTVSTTLRQPEGHVGGTWSWLWDVQRGVLQHNRITGFYNSQCCGLAVEFQRDFLGLQTLRGVTFDRRFNFSFTLAGLGTFSNPLGSFLGR